MSQKFDQSQLISIHGKRLGLNRAGHLLNDNGFLAASHWTDRGIVQRVNDPFLGPLLNPDLWTTVKGSDGGCALFAKVAKAGGYVQGTTGGGADTMAVNGVQLTGAKDFDPAFGSLLFGAAVQMSAITGVNLSVGLGDHTTLLAPFTIAAGAATAHDTDAACFVFDTGATAATWKVCTVNNGGTATQYDTGIAPVAATDDLFAIFCDILGNYTFFLNGTIVHNVALGTKTGNTLTPTVAGYSHDGTDQTFAVDFISCEQSR